MLELNLLSNNLIHPVWTPTYLFDSTTTGAWLDPSAKFTLFQDAAGTTPVTGDGDPVGLILDRSDSGNNASQSTAASRPTYRTSGGLHWLEFDGTDDFLIMNNVVLGTNDFFIFVGMQTGPDINAPDNPVYMGAGQTAAGEWMARSTNDGRTPGFFGDAGSISAAAGGLNGFATDRVYGYSRVGTTLTVYDNGTSVASDATSGGNLSTAKAIHLGGAESSTTRFLQGRIYGLVFGRQTLSTSERSDLDTYLAAKAGFTL